MRLILYSFICFTSFGVLYHLIKYIFLILKLNILNQNLMIIFIILLPLIMLLVIFIYSKESVRINMENIVNDWKKWRKFVFITSFLFAVLNIIIYLIIFFKGEDFIKLSYKINNIALNAILIHGYFSLQSILISSLKFPNLNKIKICKNSHFSSLYSKHCSECGELVQEEDISYKNFYISNFFKLLNITAISKHQSCNNGHAVSSKAKYCDQCGVKI